MQDDEGEGPGDGCCREYADEDGAADFSDFKRDHQYEAKESQRGGGITKIAETDQRLWVADDQACIAETYECDEEPDAAGDRCVEFVRNGAQNHLANAANSERKKDDAREEDRAQSGLPRDVHLAADSVGEIRIEAHAGSERDGIARHDAHEDGTERC